MSKPYYLMLLLLCAGPGWSQTAPAKTENSATLFFSAPETVLPRLYEAAIQHSGEIERLEAVKAIANEDVKLAKKKVLNIFSLASSYNYGTLPYFATASSGGASPDPVYQLNPFSQGARAVYSVGVNAVAPLDVLFGRRSTVHREELTLTRAEAERHTQEDKIRQDVIAQYQALALARVAVQHYQDALQSAGITKKIADAKFKAAEIQVDEQIAAIDFYNKAVLAEAEAKNKYQTAVLLMENLIGRPINNFMQGK